MQPSASLGASVDIFTGVIPGYCLLQEKCNILCLHEYLKQPPHYFNYVGPINNFNWEQGSSDEPIQDDPALEDYNVQDIVDMFVNEVYQYNQDYRTVGML